MKTLLAEQPLLVSIMLGVLAAGLIYGWLQTGKKAAAIVGIVVALMIPLAWLLAANWVTDRERIEILVSETAQAVENNDHESVYKVIADAATESQARAELPNYIFDVAKVTQIRSIDLLEGSYPLQADVDLTVKVTVSDRRGRFTNMRVPRRLILKLQKFDDDWEVIDYQHMPVIGGPDNFTTAPRP